MTLALWLIATTVLALLVGLGDAPRVAGGLDGLVSIDQREPAETASMWVLLEVEPASDEAVDEALTIDGVDDPRGPSHRLLEAADRVHRAFERQWVPVAAPAQEVSAWLDRHLLYLIDPSEHARLDARLTPAAMEAAARGISARLSSPLFTASGEEPRRDPLGLRPLLQRALLGAAIGQGAEATVAGDLLAADGHRLLLEIRDDDAPTTLAARVSAAVADRGVDVGATGEALRDATARSQVREGLRGPPITAAALILLILTLALRGVRSVFIVAGVATTAALILTVILGAVDLLSAPLIPLMIAIVGEGILDRPRIAAHGWAAPLLLASALVPLWITPYPLWQAWAGPWALTVAAFFILIRVVTPAARQLLGAPPPSPTFGLRLRAWPALAVLLSGALLIAGAGAAESLAIDGPSDPPLRDPSAAIEGAIRGDFFDPRAIATIDRRGDDLSDALVASIDAALPLGRAPAGILRLLDAPGALVVGDEELGRRAEALEAQAIPSRMRELEGALAAAGMRPSAFAEFLRGAADIDDQPSAARALHGPLRTWIDAHARREGEATIVRTRAFFSAAIDVPPTIAGADELRGPAVADARDRLIFGDHLGLTAAIGLWIGALVVWLATRSLALALAAAITGLLSECGALVVLLLLDLSLGPALIPALLFVGVAGVIAGARACRSIDRGEPLLAGAMVVTGLCQVAGGVALLTSPEPLWQAIGALVVGGAALAPGLGIFAAPGLHLLFRRALREAPTTIA